MKKTIFTLTLVLGLSTVLFTSCGTDEGPGTTPTPTTTTKTLDKSKLVEKEWFGEGKLTYSHKFQSGGKYRDLNGSWKWLNDSDSMEVLITPDDSPIIVYFSYCTDTEMALKTGSSTATEVVFKSGAW